MIKSHSTALSILNIERLKAQNHHMFTIIYLFFLLFVISVAMEQKYI